jgi:hypothetical protein
MRAFVLFALALPLLAACQVSSGSAASDVTSDPGADAVATPDGTGKDPGTSEASPVDDASPDAAPDPGASDLASDPGLAEPTADAAEPAPDVPEPTPDVTEATPDPGASDPGYDTSSPAIAPNQPGPWTIALVTASVTRGDRTIPVVAHVPQRADGQASPLVIFLPGFQAKAVWYVSSIDRLASHGFVVVAADPPASLFSVSHLAMAEDVTAVLDWALAANGPLAGLVDPARVGVSGHSLGGKVATMAAFADARVTALLALDPVNGGNPVTGYSDALPDIVPDQVATLTIPVGFLGETPSSVGKSAFSPACSPTDQNFQTFFAAATLAPWRAAWDLLGAGHMDFVDPDSACGVACTLCVRGDADQAAVLAATQTLLVAFYRRHFYAETGLEAWLTGADLPAGVAVTHSP